MANIIQKDIKNANLNSRAVKNKILNYLYTSNINTSLKYEPISNIKDMENIKNNDYIICPRFRGTRSWIIFFRTGDNFYAVNFPKHSKRKREDLQIHPIDISVSKEFYRGTIMEGIYFRIDKKRYLVIDEVYLLAGENQLLKPKDDRLNNLIQYIKTSTNMNPNFFMYVSQYYSVGKKSLKDLYEKIKADPKIQEIIFYPKFYSRKIYSYTIIDSDLVDTIIKLTQFRLQKTKSPDVYNLLSTTTNNKIDIAYVPDMETSKKCKQWFKDNKAKELLVKCQMDMDKKKWIPLELIEDDLDNYSDSDNGDSDNGDSDNGDSDNGDNNEYVEV